MSTPRLTLQCQALATRALLCSLQAWCSWATWEGAQPHPLLAQQRHLMSHQSAGWQPAQQQLHHQRLRHCMSAGRQPQHSSQQRHQAPTATGAVLLMQVVLASGVGCPVMQAIRPAGALLVVPRTMVLVQQPFYQQLLLHLRPAKAAGPALEVVLVLAEQLASAAVKGASSATLEQQQQHQPAARRIPLRAMAAAAWAAPLRCPALLTLLLMALSWSWQRLAALQLQAAARWLLLRVLVGLLLQASNTLAAAAVAQLPPAQ